jgi:16S rRNA (guanine(966)-N(2))-methyltransferase RsmD
MKEIRIIGGKARGLRIKSVPGDSTRPITDKVREALFNIIGADIVDAMFLDLFAGTGSVGIEALSRGARFACFVDSNRHAYTTVHENLILTRLDAHAEVFHSDAFAYINKPNNRKYDYVYIAPPQYKGLWSKALLEIDANPGWLSEDAWVIVQVHPIEYKDLNEESLLKNLIEFDQRHYGSTILIFYRSGENDLDREI